MRRLRRPDEYDGDYIAAAMLVIICVSAIAIVKWATAFAVALVTGAMCG